MKSVTNEASMRAGWSARLPGRRAADLGLVALFCLAAGLGQADDPIALRVGRVLPVSGPELQRATILIEDGRIVAIGVDLEIPRAARVWDRPDAVAMPGLVHAHTSAGLRSANEVLADVPFVSVLDGVDPSSTALEGSLRDGITSLHVAPARATRFGGQTAVVRTRGATIDELLVRSPCAMKMSLAPASGESRMGNMAELRRAFHDLWLRMRELEAAKTGVVREIAPSLEGEKRAPALESWLSPRADWSSIDWEQIDSEKIAEKDRALVDLVRGRLPAFIDVSTAADVFKAFELIDHHRLRATLVLPADAWKLTEVLAARDGLGPVVLAPELESWDRDETSGREIRRLTARRLHDAGIEFALTTEDDTRGPRFGRGGGAHLWHQAARLVAQGVPRATALRSITLTPARILGLDARLGSLEVGKDADIAIFTGDPLDARSWVDLVFIEGRLVYDRSEDADLGRLLERPERRF